MAISKSSLIDCDSAVIGTLLAAGLPFLVTSQIYQNSLVIQMPSLENWDIQCIKNPQSNKKKKPQTWWDTVCTTAQACRAPAQPASCKPSGSGCFPRIPPHTSPLRCFWTTVGIGARVQGLYPGINQSFRVPIRSTPCLKREEVFHYVPVQGSALIHVQGGVAGLPGQQQPVPWDAAACWAPSQSSTKPTAIALQIPGYPTQLSFSGGLSPRLRKPCCTVGYTQ